MYEIIGNHLYCKVTTVIKKHVSWNLLLTPIVFLTVLQFTIHGNSEFFSTNKFLLQYRC